MNVESNPPQEAASLADALHQACRRIAPAWPLENLVAVNPYLGMLSDDFARVANRLRRVAGARMTLPPSVYTDAWTSGWITREDLEASIARLGLSTDPEDLLADARRATTPGPSPSVPSVADICEEITGRQWGRFATDRVSAWAASHFDEGQAMWSPAKSTGCLYGSWRAEALLDRTPEVMGIARFRATIAALPADPLEVAAEALRRLEIPAEGQDLYLHRLLVRVGGWVAYAARLVWDRRLRGACKDDSVVQFLCILLAWEVCLYEAFADRGLVEAWSAARGRLVEQGLAEAPDAALSRDLALHLAYERARQRELITRLNGHAAEPARRRKGARPGAQAIFCIDVRSEVFRRHLEQADSCIDTLGFAGFFGFPIEFRPLAHETAGAHCPVLLAPAYRIEETIENPAAENRAVGRRRLRREVDRAWQSFKMGAVACFSFVGTAGLAYLPKLFTDAFGLTRPVAHPVREGLTSEEACRCGVSVAHRETEHGPRGIPLSDQVELAARALAAMSLTKGFARLVLITGHGSSSVNNPHATGLDCGACGGRTGDANARVAAAVLNDPAVRSSLAERGIVIPADTHFLACQHDTTTDEVRILNRSSLPESHAADLAAVERALKEAGRNARAERAMRLHLPPGKCVETGIRDRSRDWAQVRPEWGLAGCSAFIAAPRERTSQLNLGGRSFLHSYDWREDEDFSVLELIMTAPMVVASWISLQYFASTVDNQLYGAGNKTLHNVVGRIGVFEGNGGDLRVGLPWQSVHDGERYQHDPVRLNVIIEAPLAAMNAVIHKHETVRQLVDNGWLNLLAMNEEGRVSHRYTGDGAWEQIDDAVSVVPGEPSVTEEERSLEAVAMVGA